ncbi:bifunctional 5,10-methylenetetrahydrofolate dehydrogenase/5,10-methenyltetrahydrofolate cyclohydrolase [bacterium]|nr:bifunctional 5,10-methylenetetrahydrofolate dehydrogenase/5,10-methenyltetrahydrofolate cyclohydrolase [bacterium]NCQ55882.1 bifunctional 5,10-methylenetetrahydrofolate dehydrogenase/5,10-methenyltetrahydrofolate cyclohydrolase [Candidatus Parcubacteria bacterium]NCS67590.1 bifunctional 5,10-methylenetetrahydrofolate dehydrogenase/5,10-methenyltetrahydrofolate cyclohydrolase [Candidatus Peregrinibacteria bacterium]NCS96245.1 bifunctional 5,10-methylenetetrahydrofolate dehydrogenase/5,10-methe
MTALIISGKDIAENLLDNELVPRVEALKAKGVTPRLIVILIGDHAASASYVRQKEKFAERAGIVAETWRYNDSVTEAKILEEIKNINEDASIHGVIVQLPVPDHISVEKILRAIHPSKDVDGFTPENVGQLFLGEPTLECCTPKGIIRMIEASGEDLNGKHVVVVGRSNIVGKPVAILALNKNATVTICHSRTKDLEAQIAQADILIVAVGRPEMIKGDQIPEGCTVIDVGIHRKEGGGLCGDVEFASAVKKARAISPVPGGVGPMTVFCLIENTIEAAEKLS